MKASETQIIPLSLGVRSYNITIGSGLLRQAGKLLYPLLKRPFCAVVTDENVAAHHLEILEAALAEETIQSRRFILAPGEATKSYGQLAQLCDQLLAAGIERSDQIIALGGGVVGDLTGFAAAILRRGVNFTQIPTSLLAQVDASIGGKTGINSPLGKNLIGAFHQPSAVLIDLETLDSLPARHLAAGYAEIAKYGLIGDEVFFQWLEKNLTKILMRDSSALGFAVKKSCLAKAEVVAQDETDHTIRALLNFGHTFGHALEAACGFSDRLLHGEAIAIGMVMACQFSAKIGLCADELSHRVAMHFEQAGLPTHISQIAGAPISASQLMTLIEQDKKNQDGKLNLILTRGVGQAFIARMIDRAALVAFLNY